MSKFAFIALALAVALTALPCARAYADGDKLTLEQIRAQADNCTGEKCAEYCLNAADALVEHANQLFTDGASDQGHAEIVEAVKYARKATDGSIQSNKRQKKTEIALRKLSKRLTDIKQTLAMDDRPDVAEAINSIEKMRTDLLMSLFK